jgi:DNA-cytosine methyltransferase
MNVLSLFDGITTGKVALERAGIHIDNYFASEIDKSALYISKNNHSNIIHLGDVQNVVDTKLQSFPQIDLIIGGSPCQDISLVKRQERKGLKGDKSKLFFEYLRILKWLQKYNNPNIKFLLENVKGSKRDIDAITEYLDVEPMIINSSLVSAQIRKRHYWTNIKVEDQPKDKDIQLTDVLENGYTEKEKAYCLTASYPKLSVQNYFIKSERHLIFTQPIKVKRIKGGRIYHIDNQKIPIYPSLGVKENRKNLDILKQYTRKLTPVECERLQTLPDNYTEGLSNYERYKCLGNGWTTDVISHIFKYI